MKKYFLALLLFAPIINVFGGPSFKKADVLNVWAIEGLPVYEKAELKSKKTLTIPYGKQVGIVNAKPVGKPFNVQLKNGDTQKYFVLQGGWVKVKYNNHEGYVFSGYLSKMPCLKRLKLGAEPDEAYLERTYGKPEITIKKVKTETITTRVYKNGAIQTLSVYDGCADVELQLAGVSYQEALLYEHVSLFEGDAANDIKITSLKNKKIKLSYNACD